MRIEITHGTVAPDSAMITFTDEELITALIAYVERHNKVTLPTGRWSARTEVAADGQRHVLRIDCAAFREANS